MIHPEVTSQLVYQIVNSPIREHPFPHFFMENIFPLDFYQEILEQIPDVAEYQNLVDQGIVVTSPENVDIYAQRDIITLDVPEIKIKDEKKRLFWQEFAAVLGGPDFIVPLMLKFKLALLARFGEGENLRYRVMIDLIRDTEKWALGPHTDYRDKIVVILLYLPADNTTSHLGTSVYMPKETSFTCEGGPHYPREKFNCCATLPFLPNSAFGFCKNNVSFHGVESVKKSGEVRNLIQISVFQEESQLFGFRSN